MAMADEFDPPLVEKRPRRWPQNAGAVRTRLRGPVPAQPPALIRTGADLVAALRSVRRHMRVTQREFDDLAGWADGYTGKLEQPGEPWGKSATMPSFDEWLETAGVALIMVKLPRGRRKFATTLHDALPLRSATELLKGEIGYLPYGAPKPVDTT